MNAPLETYWQKIWNRPRYFFLWLTIFSAAGLGFGIAFASGTPDFHPPLWFQSLALICALVLAAGFVIGAVCFILSWIPPVHRLLDRALQRRFLILACLVTLIALFYAEENFRGKWQWEHYKHQWEAKGEKFDLADFIPPSVPEDQNLALTPLFRPLYDFVRGTNGVQWHDPTGRERLEKIAVDQVPAGYPNNSPSLGNVERGRLTDLAAWSDFYRGNTNYLQPAAPGTPAANILTALGKFDAEMAEVQKAAVTRPLSRFPIHYEDEPPFEILLPHLAHVKRLCQLFALRSIARLEAHQTEGALADLQTAFRLSDSIRDEPFVVDHLVRLSTLSIALQAVSEGLVRHAWNDAQLATIENGLASLDILAEYKKNMRGSRAFDVAGLDYYRRLGWNAHPVEVYFDDDHSGKPPFFVVLNLIPGGWYHQNMTAISKLHQDLTLAAVDEEKHRVYPAAMDSWPKVSVTIGWSPYDVFAKMIAPGYGPSPMRNARSQTYVNEARIAVALERYRLANGKLPDTLDVLAPALLAKIPTDVIDGKPLRYRLNADGSYVVYSIAWNQADDGGIGPTSESKRDGDIDKADWVWQGGR